MFSNMMREQTDRTFGGKRLIGEVVNNDDSGHPDGKRLQRIQIRYPEMHDEIEDADLPWQTPGGLDAFSGGTDVGNHGPIPPVGSKVYGRFEDDSQYHGQYLGGVAHTDNQIPEFVKPQGGAPGGTPTSSSDNANSGDNSSDGDQSQPAADNPKTSYDFTKNYPQPYGHVNASGDFFGHDPYADYTEHTLVSGTSKKTDGVGNTSLVINGSKEDGRKDNSNAKALLPEGFTAAVFGNGTIYLSKDVSIVTMGNASITAKGNATITASGNASVVAKGDATVSARGRAAVTADGGVTVGSKGDVSIVAGGHLQLTGSSITSSTNIPIGGGGSPGSASDVTDPTAQTAPAARSRPVAGAAASSATY